MKKRDKLYTVNKWNKNQFCGGGHKFSGLDELTGKMNQAVTYTRPSLASVAGGIDLPKTIASNGPQVTLSPTQKFNAITGAIGAGAGSGSLGALGAASTLVNQLGTKLISDGYSTGGIGEGIGTAGAVIGDIVGQINPVAGLIVKGASGIVGGVVNRGFGTKKNDKNISAIQTNTADARNAGNLLASSTTSDALLNSAGSMTTSSNFDTRDLVKGGWFAKGKAKKQGQKYITAEDSALAYQNHGMTIGANKVDNNIDNTAQSNFIYAFGGPLDYMAGSDMGAINYGFMTDYLTTKKKQAEASNKVPGISPMANTFGEGGIEIKHPGRLTRLKERTGKTEAELWAEGRPEVRKMITFARNARKWSKALGGKIERDGVTIPDNVFCGGGKMFALGGDIQMNGADFTNGMQHINAGGSHEESPYEGVQVGIDPQGIPNLVEEGEVIYNDYVYSNRIPCDDETKAKFRLSKKRDITYADLAKRLEKESLERPNDPISKAALKKQMEDLANEQERQKQEMEAQRAKEAFEALSPEEQIAMMQQASQQEQMAQEQAMQEQAAQEQMAAQQQAVQEQQVPEEAMAQQPMTPEEAQQQQIMAQQMAAEQMAANPEMANMSAYGGPVNKFTPGGRRYNAGTWKSGNSSTNWNAYTKQGLVDYLNNIVTRINGAKSEDEKNAIRQEAINTVNGIQNAYRNAYQASLTPSEENTAVKTLQTLFQNAGGNAHFNGIENAINLPVGHNTLDTQQGGWIDSLWGPRTSIRNWGSTEYGDTDYYKDISDLASRGGFNYGIDPNLTYGNGFQLYNLSLANAPISASTPPPSVTPRDSAKELLELAGNPTVDKIDRVAGTVPTRKEIREAMKKASDDSTDEYVPRHRPEWLRYVGLFGPAVGLGMQALGIGRPDTKALDAVLEGYDKRGAATADYRTIGDYLTYRPMDIWAEQNRMNANARATDRAIQNNAAPIGTQMAGLLASNYNDQNASGQLYRQALEYNDNLRRMTGEFNRGTNQFNAQAYNQAALQNAEIRNRERQIRAQLGMQAAAQKADMDAGWYNGIYGNVSGLFKGISDIGRENAQHNMIARGIADGVWGVMTPDTNTAYGYLKPNADGGKVTRKKNKKHRKGGLTF